MASRRRAAGRPTGTKNAQYDAAEGKLTRCAKCGSTERAPYFGQPNITEYSGLDEAGQPYTHIVRRRTRCLACDQVRFDMYRENRT